MSEDDGFATKNWVWVPDKDELFVRGYITDYLDSNQSRVTIKNGAQEVVKEFDQKVLESCNPPKFNKCDDMAELTHLNEPSVIYNLFLRYNDDLIYTYSGLFLVAINPYKKLPIYEQAELRKFHNQKHEKLPPHIFAIAENTYRNLVANTKDQLILVTGESGAGKTENTKKIIQYLSSISSSDDEDIHNKILRANPILESFGNAKTIKNNNSSRFGKFIKIYFDQKGLISGATIDYYLLEKSRVLHQSKDERNYHAFYQLLKGEDLLVLLEKYNLTPDIQAYKYLSSSSATIPNVDDAKDFKVLSEAFAVMGFSNAEIESVFSLMAIVLHLGNIDFTSWKSEQASFSSDSKISTIAEMLGISDHDLSTNLLRPKVKAGREYVQKLRTAAEVKHNIDAFAKHLYEKVFQFIIARINVNLVAGDFAGEKFIGVLDIAGFEIFESNSFEQLCINYTNEKLQQFFNHHSFILEQSEYLREDIQWEFIDFGQDLQPTIDLIETKQPMGILEILNEQCIIPKASEQTFITKLLETWGNGDSKKFRPNKVRSGFIVDHYAGLVEYNVDNWIQKNTDPVSESILQLLPDSSNSFISELFANDEHLAAANSRKTPKLKTVSQKHKEQLSFLMQQLSSTEPHFVRCILPNLSKRPNRFDKELVLHQLRCNGVLEGIRIARAGYPNKMTFEEFFNRYAILTANEIVFTKNTKTSCELILKQIELDPELFKIGITKLFFKNGILGNLEELRDLSLKKVFTNFQSAVRGQLVRKSFRRLIAVIQASQVVARNFQKLDNLINKNESPWLKLFVSLKPLLEESVKVLDSKEMNESLMEINGKLKEAESARSALEAENQTLRTQVTNLEDDMIKTTAIVTEKSDILRKLKKEESSRSTELTDVTCQLSEIKVVNEKLAKNKAELTSKLDELLKKLEKAEKLLNSLTEEYKKQKENVAELEAQIKDLKSVQKDYAEAKSAIADLKKQSEKNEAIQNEFEGARNTILELEEKVRLKEVAEREVTTTKSGMEEELQKLKTSHKDLESSIETHKSTHEKHLTEIKELKSHKDIHEKKVCELERTHQSLKTELKESQSEFERQQKSSSKDYERNLEDLTRKYERAVEKVISLENELRAKTGSFSEQARQHHETERKLQLLAVELEDSKRLEKRLADEKAKSSSLLAEVEAAKDKVSSHVRENKSLLESFEHLKHEAQYLLRAKAEYSDEIMKLKEQIQDLEGKLQDKENVPPMSAKTMVDADFMDEFASIKLKLNELSAVIRKEKYENQRLSQEVNILRQKLNENFESPLKRSELRRSLAIGEDIRFGQTADAKYADEIEKMQIRLKQEETNVTRAETYAIELQKKLNKLQMTRGINSFTDYEAKYKDSQKRIVELEKKIGQVLDDSQLLSPDFGAELNLISRSSSVGTVSLTNGGGDFAKIYKDINKTLKSTREELSKSKTEILRLKSLLRDSEDELYAIKSTNVRTSIRDYEDDLARLKVSNETLLKKNEDVGSALTKYKNRSDEYYAKLELAESAVSISKRHEQQYRKELEERTTQLKLLREETRASEKVIRQLRQDKNGLEDKLDELRHREEHLQSQKKQLDEKLRYLNDNYGDTKHSIAEHKEEIRSLHNDIKFKLEKETDLIKENKRVKIENDELARIKEEVLAENTEVTAENDQLTQANEGLKTEVEHLKNEREIHVRKLEQTAKLVEALKSLIEDNTRQMETMNETNRQLEELKFLLENHVADLQDKLKEANMNLEMVREHYDTIDKEKKQMREELDTVRGRWDVSDGQYKQARTDNLVLVEENESLRKVNEVMKQKVGVLEEKLYSNEQLKYLESNIVKLSGDIDALKHELHESDLREQKLLKQMKSLEYDNDNKIVQMKRYNDENFNYQNVVGQYQSKVEFLHQENCEKDLKMKAQERELTELREQALVWQREKLVNP